MDLRIRYEEPGDRHAIRLLLERAFDSQEEANIVDKLRTSNAILISLVAQVDEQVAGHIVFSPVTIHGESAVHEAIALGPLAVLPKFQGRGIGSELVREGLAACRAAGYPSVVVLGHPWFYPKFGFKPASAYEMYWKADVLDEAFMVIELIKGYLDRVSGVVEFHPAFFD